MAKKKHRYNERNKYVFDAERGEYVEKESYKQAKQNPIGIIYVRVSDPKQVEQGNGLESQEATCRRYAGINGIKITKVFSDAGESGAKVDRKGLLSAIEYLNKENYKIPKIGFFICSEISRLSRSESLEETGKIIQKIEETGTNIITANDSRNISKKDISETFMTDITIIKAKHERLDIKQRSMNGSIRKLEQGYWIFHPPVGYKRIQIKEGRRTIKMIKKQEPQASIVKEGLEAFANGVFKNNTQMLKFFNDKNLQSNYHSPNPGKLNLMFIKRIIDIERLYVYAGFVLYPKYGFTKPIEGVHEAIIDLSTVKKILKKIDTKGNLKFGPRKDSSDKYPLRGSVYCPYCNYPMTARASTSGTGKKYDYYGCNRKECKEKENINTSDMHHDFEELLQKITPKKGVIKLLDKILKDTIKDKNKTIKKTIESKKRRIKQIEEETKGLADTIHKLNRVELIQKAEEKRANLEEEKELLEEQIKNKTLNENDFQKLYTRIKNIIEDPLSIRELGTTELKILLIGVLFGGKLYYKKNEGFQTPHLSVIYDMFGHFDSDNVTSGAGDGTRTRNQQLGRLGL